MLIQKSYQTSVCVIWKSSFEIHQLTFLFWKNLSTLKLGWELLSLGSNILLWLTVLHLRLWVLSNYSLNCIHFKMKVFLMEKVIDRSARNFHTSTRFLCAYWNNSSLGAGQSSWGWTKSDLESVDLTRACMVVPNNPWPGYVTSRTGGQVAWWKETRNTNRESHGGRWGSQPERQQISTIHPWSYKKEDLIQIQSEGKKTGCVCVCVQVYLS